jgi:hypothetical protein
MERTGRMPFDVQWHQAESLIPWWLPATTDAAFAEGVAWKLAPVRLFHKIHELSLDNDVILWRLPLELECWLSAPDACLISQDVWGCFGAFAHLCGSEPRNSGIRGLPPDLDYEIVLHKVLNDCPASLAAEVDEQGFQVAALLRAGRALHVVRTEEVTICSPFPPHQQHLGTCGAHFVGLNTKFTRWMKDGRPGHEHLRDHWYAHRAVVKHLCGLVE